MIRTSSCGGGAWLASAVLVEACWVLRIAYEFDRSTIASTLHQLLATEGIHVEEEGTTLLALAAFEAGSADFSDYFVLETARRAGALPLHAFDEQLGKSGGTELV